jgi:N-acetylmuramoyl-L-alanine amidase
MMIVVGLAAASAWASSVKGTVRAGLDPCTNESPVAAALGDPFGHFDGVGTNLSQNVVSNTVPLIGWALDDDGVAAVDITVDGLVVGRARYGDTRPDVPALFPGFPDGALSGWLFTLDTTNFLNGEHLVSGFVVSNAGEVRALNARIYQFDNNTHNLAPFGKIDFPNPNSDAFGKCNLADPVRRYTVISGWALDAGVENNDHGVGYVELLLDGGIIANSRLDCRHSPVTGAYSNCYGQRRLDVEQQYPTLKDSPNAGFRFVLDIGVLVNLGWSEGHHTFTARVGDIDSQVANIASINVDFFCDPLGGGIDRGAVGAVDVSPERPLATGFLEISGWALDPDGIERIEVYVDGHFVGNAVFGFPRPEITSQYPGFPDSLGPGWLFSLDTRTLSQGHHSVQVLTVDSLDFEDLIGEITFETSNP